MHAPWYNGSHAIWQSGKASIRQMPWKAHESAVYSMQNL